MRKRRAEKIAAFEEQQRSSGTNEDNAGATDSRDKQSNDRTNDTVKAAMEKISFERD